MPTLGENEAMWSRTWDWSTTETAWSGGWGGAAWQWHGSVLPRLWPLLPAATVVEVGCGQGRWTGFLASGAQRVWALDLVPGCAAATAELYAGDDRVVVHRTDGRSLRPVPDASVDLVFSFDSLVHADPPVLDAYLGEFDRVLAPEGRAFVHHSNLADCPLPNRVRRPARLRRALVAARLAERDLHWRDPAVGHRWFAAAAERHGLRCTTQELVAWSGGRRLIDCLSTVVRAGSALDTGRHVVANRHFGAEAPALARLAAARPPS